MWPIVVHAAAVDPLSFDVVVTRRMSVVKVDRVLTRRFFGLMAVAMAMSLLALAPMFAAPAPAEPLPPTDPVTAGGQSMLWSIRWSRL